MGTPDETARLLDELVDGTVREHSDDAVLGDYLTRYVQEVPDDDLDAERAAEVLDSALSHLDLGRRRQPNEVLVAGHELPVRVGRPAHSSVLIVCDDLPFLVDTVRLVLDRHGIGIGLLVHPMLPVIRDAQQRLVGFDDQHGAHEAWIQIQIDACSDHMLADVESQVCSAIADVVRVVGDFEAMGDRLRSLAESDELLSWLAEQHFVFLGAATYDRVVDASGQPHLELRAGTELGEYRPEASFDATSPGLPSKPGDERVVIARSDSVAAIHRAARMTSIAVRTDDGSTEHRFFGLLGSGAYRESVFAIPVLRDRANAVLALSGWSSVSYTGRAIKNVVETLPRELVFELDDHALAELVIDIVGLQERRIVRVFDVAEPVGPWTTVLVYIPRARFDADTPDRVAELVADHYDSLVRDVGTLVGASSLARISMTVLASEAVDLERLAATVDRETASWNDRARAALVELVGAEQAEVVFDRVRRAIPRDYRARVAPEHSAPDLVRVVSLLDVDPHDPGAALGTSLQFDGGEWRFRVFRRGDPLTIAELVPYLNHLGLHALDQRPYTFECRNTPVHLYDLGVRPVAPGESTHGADAPERLSKHGDIGEVQRAFSALLRGDAEADGLNALVLVAGLTVRQVAVLRTYSRFLQQATFPFSQQYIEQALVRHPLISHGLASMFDARFDPAAEPVASDSMVVVDATRSEILRLLDDVPSLDDDRICRAFLTLIDATVRTNAFRRRITVHGDTRPPAVGDEIAVKIDSRQVPFLPQPRPLFEIFVCSPKVEGVHLRAGRVARGGLRWSDRREDFRTEVLGLVKAQMVKNAVIVPVGAKGGFVVKQGSAPPGDRDAVRAEGVDRYQRFIRSLLDVTDNLVTSGRAAGNAVTTVVHPPNCVVHDGDDPYLVVAADKGTATFSDIANGVAADYGFWLGDAFASGGSNGYDHKAMGITARGAWESVRRHARVIGKDVETDEVTAVGVGDMSGDVFGNGMLLSTRLKLVAAFDHRHVFLDPDPDPTVSWAERKRLFELPRSSWADYDETLISAGGGVFPRTLKSIPITAEVRNALGLEAGVTAMRPDELLSAVLLAPVDLLWNGGIGTYVKASTESHESVGDRANDSIRVDGSELRCRIVGEGGNLGFTQLGRVEFAVCGGLIYTDAIDNSAGVDCSDHEVNIKVALEELVSTGVLTETQRNDLLVAMTGEVADLVLDTNRAQTMSLLLARRQALGMVNVHARYLDALESEGHIDRALEQLPTDKQIAERQAAGSGLRAPEFAVMIAFTKNVDIEELMESDVADLAVLEHDLFTYFPTELRERYPEAIRNHPLRREIIATCLVNNMVNLCGFSFDHRMGEQSGASIADVTRAFLASRNIVGFNEMWNEIDALGAGVDLDTQAELFLEARRMAERCSTWLLRRRPMPLDVEATIDDFGAGIAFLAESLDDLVGGRVLRDIAEVREERLAAGVPTGLARRSSRWKWLHTGFDIIDLAHGEARNVADAAQAYWAVFEAFDVNWLWDGIGELPRSDRWQTQARASLRDDLMTVVADLTRMVLRTADGSPEAWMAANERPVARVKAMETEIRRAETFNLTTLSVALRQLRNLTLSAGPA